MHILKPTFCQLPFGTYIILLFSYYEVQFSWQETVDMIGPHEVNLLTWCRTKAFTTLMQIITKDPLLKPSQLCNSALVGHSDVIISLWRDKALQCTFPSIVLQTTLAKEIHLNAIGPYRPYNIFSDIQENIDHHSQPTLGEKISMHHFTFLFAISTNPMPCTDSQASNICTCSKFLYQQINSHNLCAGWTAPPTYWCS